MLYVQYREIDDINTGRRIAISPVYHAIDRHLYCDDKYWIAEPVANIEKGAIQEPIKLSYVPSWPKMGDLNDSEMNDDSLFFKSISQLFKKSFLIFIFVAFFMIIFVKNFYSSIDILI